MTFQQVPSTTRLESDVCSWDDEHDLPESIIVWDLDYRPRVDARVFCDDDCEGQYIDRNCEDGFY